MKLKENSKKLSNNAMLINAIGMEEESNARKSLCGNNLVDPDDE